MAQDTLCDVCGQNTGKKKINDGVVCKECLRKTPPSFAGIFDRNKITVDQFRTAVQEKEKSDQRLAQFQASDQVGKHFAIDTTHNWFLVSSDICLPFDAIVDYDVVENGNTVNKKGLGTAVVGGVLFGGAGALIGHSMGKKQMQEITDMYIKISTQITGYSVVRIKLISGRTKSNSFTYKAATKLAEEIMSLLATATSMVGNGDQSDQAASLSVADELMKLSQLLDSGVLTQQEFDEQKSRLLS